MSATVLSPYALEKGVSLRALQVLAGELENWLDLSDVTAPLEDKARLMHAVEQVQKQFGAFRAELAALLYADMPDDNVTIDSLPPLVRSHGSRRKNWSGYRAAADVTSKTLEQLRGDDGVVPPVLVVAEAVRDALVRCGGLDNASHSWRSGELKARDLNPDEYSEWERGNPTVKFVYPRVENREVA